MTNISNENLFKQLYFSKTEKDVEDVILNNPNVFRDDNWYIFSLFSPVLFQVPILIVWIKKP